MTITLATDPAIAIFADLGRALRSTYNLDVFDLIQAAVSEASDTSRAIGYTDTIIYTHLQAGLADTSDPGVATDDLAVITFLSRAYRKVANDQALEDAVAKALQAAVFSAYDSGATFKEALAASRVGVL